ncbi:MAG: LysM peptidoglycan-binding domain-containing protein [Sedimentisphaerales bacterium]
MQKDFKIGMALGLVLLTIVVVLLSTRPSLSIRARMPGPHSAGPLEATTIGKTTRQNKPLTAVDRPAQRDELKLPQLSANEQPKEIKTERFHIVREGETLSDISYKYYGSADKWQKILGADHLPIKNPSKIRPGTRLIIPE